MKTSQDILTVMPSTGFIHKSHLESLEEELGDLADQVQLARDELFEAIETATMYRLRVE